MASLTQLFTLINSLQALSVVRKEEKPNSLLSEEYQDSLKLPPIEDSPLFFLPHCLSLHESFQNAVSENPLKDNQLISKDENGKVIVTNDEQLNPIKDHYFLLFEKILNEGDYPVEFKENAFSNLNALKALDFSFYKQLSKFRLIPQCLLQASSDVFIFEPCSFYFEFSELTGLYLNFTDYPLLEEKYENLIVEMRQAINNLSEINPLKNAFAETFKFVSSYLKLLAYVIEDYPLLN
jgi:hypothetical protein